MVHSKNYWGKRSSKSLASSADTDLWIVVLLGMSCGHIFPLGERGGGSDGAASGVWGYQIPPGELSVQGNLQDGSEPTWLDAELSRGPDDELSSRRLDDTAKVRLFVLVYLWAGCESLPTISKLPFLRMWDSL